MANEYNSYIKRCSPLGVPSYFGELIDPVTGASSLVPINADTYVNGAEGNSAGCSGGFGGQSPNRTTRGRGIRINPIYDYVIKQANNGTVKYFGAIVDGEQEILTPITADLFSLFTGQPDVYSKNGVFRFRPPIKPAKDLVTITKRIGEGMGLSRSTINKTVDLLPMIETARMFLTAMKVPVADFNDPYEVFTKYLHVLDENNDIMPEGDYALAIGERTVGRMKNSFDWGSLFGGVVDFFSGLISAGTEASDAQELNSWMVAYDNYMAVDFADIDRETAEKGPQAGLDWLLRLKRTSWADLKNYNLQWCQAKGLQVPQHVLDVQRAQLDLEESLRDRIAAGAAVPIDEGTNNNHHYNPTGGMGSGSSFSIDKLLVPAMVAIALIFVLKK